MESSEQIIHKILNKYSDVIKALHPNKTIRCSINCDIIKNSNHPINININKFLLLPSASTRKISILLAVLHYIEKNNIELTHIIHLSASDRTIQTPFNSGIIKNLSSNQYNLMELLYCMIVYSDNIATKLLIRMVGLDYVISYCKSIGLTDTNHKYDIPDIFGKDASIHLLTTTSTYDLNKLLMMMWSNSKRLDLSYRFINIALKLMKNAKREKIAKFIPPHINVYRKGGTGERGVMDSGFIEFSHDSNYYHIFLSILTDGIHRSRYHIINHIIAQLSSDIFDIVKNHV